MKTTKAIKTNKRGEKMSSESDISPEEAIWLTAQRIENERAWRQAERLAEAQMKKDGYSYAQISRLIKKRKEGDSRTLRVVVNMAVAVFTSSSPGWKLSYTRGYLGEGDEVTEMGPSAFNQADYSTETMTYTLRLHAVEKATLDLSIVVRERATGSPTPRVLVRLLDEQGALLQADTTEEDGQVTLRLRRGTYQFEFLFIRDGIQMTEKLPEPLEVVTEGFEE
jgi:hypothetical protein